MSLGSAVHKPKKSNYTALGLVIGAGIALLLSALGLEVEISVGVAVGLCIGAFLDKRGS